MDSELIKLTEEIHQLKTIIEQKDSLIEELLIKDPLTGAGNREYLNHIFSELKCRALRFKYDSALAMIDIKNFRKVNESKGSEEGDRLLRRLSTLAIKRTRAGLDYVFRVGGDEFLIIFTNCNSSQASVVLDRINKKFCMETEIASLAYGVTNVDFRVVNALEVHMSMADRLMNMNKSSFSS